MCGSIDFGLVDQVANVAVPQCTPDLLHSPNFIVVLSSLIVLVPAFLLVWIHFLLLSSPLFLSCFSDGSELVLPNMCACEQLLLAIQITSN